MIRSILEVDDRGNITTHKAGVATITVTTGGPNKNSDKVTITVLPKGEASIVITNAPGHPLKKGSTHDLGYLYMDEEEISHTQENAPVDVTWEQGTKAVLTVGANGVVRAIGTGTLWCTPFLNQNRLRLS